MPENLLARLWNALKIAVLILLTGILFAGANLQTSDPADAIRKYTRSIEFDFVNWTVKALFVKNQTIALGLDRYLPEEQGQAVLTDYFQQVDDINVLRSEINTIYADPNIRDPENQAAGKAAQLSTLEKENEILAALSESVLQQQVSTVAADLGLAAGGQLIPPLLYRMTPLPLALIISPRDVIRQDADISLTADLSVEKMVELEQQIEQNENVSALVVNIGGVGIYPTMVLRTTNLSWMIETIAHEWVHNFLTLRPMGMLYMHTPQLRTMNETTASLAGREIAIEVYKRWYPQFVPVETPPSQQTSPEQPAAPEEPPPFDFNNEMHETRITVDEMLANGKIEEAEKYMEARRLFFWENGYQLRRINQAYFAFYGAYADQPGGQAGEDPVGPAVRKLRQQSDSLAQFLNRISWMTSFDRLLEQVSGAQ